MDDRQWQRDAGWVCFIIIACLFYLLKFHIRFYYPTTTWDNDKWQRRRAVTETAQTMPVELMIVLLLSSHLQMMFHLRKRDCPPSPLSQHHHLEFMHNLLHTVMATIEVLLMVVVRPPQALPTSFCTIFGTASNNEWTYTWFTIRIFIFHAFATLPQWTFSYPSSTTADCSHVAQTIPQETRALFLTCPRIVDPWIIFGTPTHRRSLKLCWHGLSWSRDMLLSSHLVLSDVSINSLD